MAFVALYGANTAVDISAVHSAASCLEASIQEILDRDTTIMRLQHLLTRVRLEFPLDPPAGTWYEDLQVVEPGKLNAMFEMNFTAVLSTAKDIASRLIAHQAARRYAVGDRHLV